MCTKTVKIALDGVIRMVNCNKPECKDGLCARHYLSSGNQKLNWNSRKDYKPATQEDFTNQKLLKLSDTNEHNSYKFVEGNMMICDRHTNTWNVANVVARPNLFCVKSI